MIRKQTALSVLPIATALTEQNVAVSPKPGTVIAELFKWSMGTMIPEVSTEDREFEFVLQNSDTVVSEGMSGHSAVIDGEVLNTSKVLAHQLKYTKDTAKVLLDKTFESISAEVNAYSKTDISIREVAIRDIYLTDSFASLMEVYKDSDFNAVKCLPVTFTETPDEVTLLKAISTGSVGFDNLLLKILGSKPEGWLVKVFKDNFTGAWSGPKDYDSKTNSDILIYKPSLNYLDETLAVFLLAVSFEESPIPGFSGDRLTLRKVLAGLVRATAVSMVITIADFNRQTQLGNLLISTPELSYMHYSVSGEVVVNAKHYHEFLEQGGTPEAIFGAAITKQGRPYTLKNVLERSVELVATYHRSCTERDASAKENVMDGFKNEALSFFHEFLDNTAKFDYPVLTEYEDAPNGYHVFVNEVVSDILPRRWAEEPYLALREMFNRILWRGTNTENLLSVIDQEMARHGDLEPREAAYRATISILLDHYLGQVDIERVKV